MESKAPTGGARRGFRRWRRWLVGLALLPLAVFGLSNLALNSPWARHWIASKIQQRTTLETRIGGASWSPWNGASLRDLRIEQPEPLRPLVGEPLFRVSLLRAKPVWRSWLKGNPELKGLTLQSPELVLPLELIAHFSPANLPPTAAATPENPLSPPAPTPALAANPGTPPEAFTPPPPGPTAPPTASTVVPAAPAQAPALPAPPPPATIAPQVPTDFVHLHNASFSLVFGGNKTPLCETRGISGAIPVLGAAADSELRIASIRFLGSEALKDLRLPIRWQSPLISLPPTATEIGGHQITLGGQIGLLAGLPAAFEAIVPPQATTPVKFLGDNTFDAAQVSANTRFVGQLLAPATWQADFANAASQPVVTFNNQVTKFDHAQAFTVLRGGTLSCIDARLVSDPLSFLGNATVLSNGRAAGVMRIVAPPETTTLLVNQLFPGLKAPPAFSSMSTPQRAALDLEAFGSLGDLQFRLGKNGPVVGAPTPPATVTPP